MPANNAYGYPYPLGTDRLMDGDDAIKALADAIMNKLRYALMSGTVTVPVSSGSAVGTAAVTFPAGMFAAPPGVVATYNGTNVAWSLINVSAVTTSGCTIGVSHRDGTASGSNTSMVVWWHAHQS